MRYLMIGGPHHGMSIAVHDTQPTLCLPKENSFGRCIGLPSASIEDALETVYYLLERIAYQGAATQFYYRFEGLSVGVSGRMMFDEMCRLTLQSAPRY